MIFPDGIQPEKFIKICRWASERDGFNVCIRDMVHGPNMNHLKDWDGHRDVEVTTERDEKKRVLRQKTLSLESFFIREFFWSDSRSQLDRLWKKNLIREKTEKPKNFLQLDRYRQHELARQRLAAIKHIRFLFDSLDSNDEDQMFCGLKKILECEKERLRTIRSSDSSSGLSPFGSLRKYMKSNKTSCPTLNTLFRDPRTYKIQPDYFIIVSYFDIWLALGSLTCSTQNEVQVCEEDNDEFEYFSKSMIAVNKPADGQSSPESQRYTLDQFIDDHIRRGFQNNGRLFFLEDRREPITNIGSFSF